MAEEIRKLNQPAPRGTWVQTERAAHEAWAQLIDEAPRAAQLLHRLVANMDETGGLVASHATLAKLNNVSVATTKRALKVLTDNNWVQAIRIGGDRGGCLAYIVNSRVAWASSRENLKLASFSARVIVSSEDQQDLGSAPLRQAPSLGPGDMQLPAGPGMEPPAQGLLEGFEPDLPSLPLGHKPDES
ncbi:helix-turn-helix domain-containing protein (plasmid) [Pseudomonas fluorescens]|nr:helix-turn-helix domain-containing protein [Pseudomonas fluorescens]